MSFYKRIASRINLLRRSCEGSLFVCTAIILPVILMAIGMAIDISSWVYCRNALKQASHATILAASTELSESLEGFSSGKVTIKDIKEYARQYLKGSLYSDFSKEEVDKIIKSVEIDIDKNRSSQAYEIKIHPHYEMPLNSFSFVMHAIGIKSMGVDLVVKGYARRPESSHKEMAETIQLVVDVSGSMGSYLREKCYGEGFSLETQDNRQKIGIIATRDSKSDSDSARDPRNPYEAKASRLLSCDKSLYEVLHPLNSSSTLDTIQELRDPDLGKIWLRKMVALKDAVAGFIRHLQKIKNIEDKVLISSVSFSEKIELDHDMSWGFKKAIDFFASLDATYDARTDSSVGMQRGYDNIANLSKSGDQKVIKHNLKARKHIILLTDGQNSNFALDKKTSTICEKAKEEGINIFTIAFAINDAEESRATKLLKSCATSSDTYFNVRDSGRLNEVFKEIASKISVKRVVRVTQ